MILDEHFRYFKPLEKANNDTLEVDINNASKHVHYLGIKKDFFNHMLGSGKLLIILVKENREALKELTITADCKQYIDFLAFAIAKIRSDLAIIKGRKEIILDYNSTITINERSNGIKELIRVLEYYVKYEKTSGGDNDLLNSSISLKPPMESSISIKNGEIVHSIIGTVFREFTGIKDAYKIKDDTWKEAVIEMFVHKDIDNEINNYLTYITTSLRTFFIEEKIYQGDVNKKMPTRIAKWITEILELADFDIPDKSNDKDNIWNWYNRKLR